MLLKTFVDDSFPIPVPPGTSSCVWLVQEELPLAHPQQLKALFAALAIPKDAQAPLDFDALQIIANGARVDATKTPLQLRLAAGSVVSISAAEPSTSPRSFARRAMSLSPRAARAGSVGGALAANASSASAFATATPRGQQSGDDDEDAETRARGGSAMEEEVYVSEGCGWFPFVIPAGPPPGGPMSPGAPRVGAGGSVASPRPAAAAPVQYINAEVEPAEDDAAPALHALCDACAAVVRRTDGVHAEVERHYRPAMLAKGTVEGYGEKYGNGIGRWQRRYFVASEKSLNWYDERPNPTEDKAKKQKVRGTCLLWQGTTLLLEDVIANPDPAKYPKCKEPGRHHFGLTLKEPAATTVLIRVATLAEKERFVLFFNGIVKRAASKMAPRDPVFWKKWADAFLANLADLGELENESDELGEQLVKEVAALEARLADAEARRRPLEAAVAAAKEDVARSAAELQLIEDRARAATRGAERAEARVAAARAELRDAAASAGDAMHQSAMLEARLEEQRREAEAALAVVQANVEAILAKERRVFGEWRKFEEHHRDRQGASASKRQLSFSLVQSPELY